MASGRTNTDCEFWCSPVERISTATRDNAGVA
jgi:hypothetical protein